MSTSGTPPGATHRGSPWSQELIEHLKPYASVRHVERGERLDLEVNGQGMCYLIIEGSVAIYRSSDNMLLSTSTSPGVFGLANLTDVYFDDYLKTIKPCTIGFIDTQTANTVIKEKGLWKLVSDHLMVIYDRLYHHIMPRGAATAYDMVRQQLFELMNEEESFRHDITAERYIREKTHLSRSGVMRILADLKAGGYVEMEDGVLMKIHKLPAKY
ncbi:winged helix-turn-helix transcriptional regulator [Lelliottia sp. WAP21]|uniref:winged helix-turn-helix transcriptional regulator n=1 Tax=Lelliottia sp. WAP21 TaxID=2877426 RepID=UPI001E33B067|nr:winged helix-turn-helix transcriptional regulator [Lelliottia sp. WAP21]